MNLAEHRNVSDVGANILSFIGIDANKGSATRSEYPIEITSFYIYDPHEMRYRYYKLRQGQMVEEFPGENPWIDPKSIIGGQVVDVVRRISYMPERREEQMRRIARIDRGINEERIERVKRERAPLILEAHFAAANSRLMDNLQAPTPSGAYYDDSDTIELNNIIGPANTEVIHGL